MLFLSRFVPRRCSPVDILVPFCRHEFSQISKTPSLLIDHRTIEPSRCRHRNQERIYCSSNVPAASSGFCKKKISLLVQEPPYWYSIITTPVTSLKNSRIQRQPFLRLFLRDAFRTDSRKAQGNLGCRVSLSCR